jgi:hypothetical protein
METVTEDTEVAMTSKSLESSELNESAVPILGLMVSIANMESSIIHMTHSVTARLNLYTTAPPKVILLKEDCEHSHEELLHELQSVRQQLFSTYQALGCALGQLSASNAHCTSIQRELGDIHTRLDNVTKKREEGSKKTKSWFPTSRNLCGEFDHEEEEREEHEHVATEKGRQKEAETAKHAHCVAEDSPNQDSMGQLASYKKDDLRLLAIALSLNDKGTNNELQSHIDAHFKAHPDVQKNSQFSGLFNKGSHHQKSHPNIADIGADNTIDSSEESGGEGSGEGQPSPPPPPPAIPATCPHPHPIPTQQATFVPQPTIHAPHSIANPHTPYLQYPPNQYNYYSLDNPGPSYQDGQPRLGALPQYEYYNPSHLQ